MSEAPERIWAAISSRHGWRTTDRKPVEDVVDICGYKEYIRADIHEARVEDLENKLAKALGALQAFKDFDDLPFEWKRPDVFEIEARKPMLRTLAEMQHKEDKT